MAVQLRLGDVVLVYINNSDEKHEDIESSKSIQIGIIKYIGYIHGFPMTENVGLELVEPTDGGHNGIINGYQYFDCPKGHGLHTKLTNIIRKVEAAEITLKMQQIIIVYKSRLDEYVKAVSQRDAYIEELKNKHRYLREELQNVNGQKQASADKLHEIQKEILSNNPIKSPITPITPIIPSGGDQTGTDSEYPGFGNITSTSTYHGTAGFNDHSSNSTHPGTVLLDNNNSSGSTIMFTNIERKSGVFLNINNNDSNKKTVIFTPNKSTTSKSTKNKSTKKSDSTSKSQYKKRIKNNHKKNWSNMHREYSKYNGRNKYKSKRKESITTEEESVLDSSSSDEGTETQQTEEWSSSDYADDESSIDGKKHMMDSTYSITTKHTSKVSQSTSISESEYVPKMYRNKNIKNRNVKSPLQYQSSHILHPHQQQYVHNHRIFNKNRPHMVASGGILYVNQSVDSNHHSMRVMNHDNNNNNNNNSYYHSAQIESWKYN